MSSTTIAALATAPQPAGLAVVRVSGPQTRFVLKALFRSKLKTTKRPRELIIGDLIDFKTGEKIDNALAVFFPGPRSYTGEDVCEFQFHGSPLLVQRVLRSLYAFGVEPAAAGEFTKRAFLHGKCDLTQAEAISDLVHATSEQALKIASEQLAGRFSNTIRTIGEPLRDILAELEASIDFPEEGIEPTARENMSQQLGVAESEIERLLRTYNYGSTLREGLRVAICGRPNVGKSSILNRLVGEDKAIVTNVSGTTRDAIEAEAIFGGYRFLFCDTAGLRNTNDLVESIGIQRADDKISRWADLVLFVVDGSDVDFDWSAMAAEIRSKAKKVWMLTNKIDLNPTAVGTFFCDSAVCAQNFYLSAKTGDGMESLIDALTEEVKHGIGDTADASHVVTNERHRDCLERAAGSLERARDSIGEKLPVEITCAEVRGALNALEEIIGATTSDDILGRVFSKFCIGK